MSDGTTLVNPRRSLKQTNMTNHQVYKLSSRFFLKGDKYPYVVLAVSALLVSGLLSGCEPDLESDVAASNLAIHESVALNSPDGIRPEVSLITPEQSSFLTSPIMFSIEGGSGAPEEVAIAEYYFRRQSRQIGTRDEHIFLGTASGTEPFIYEGPVSSIVPSRFGTREAGVVGIDDDGDAAIDFNNVIPPSNVEVVTQQSVREATPEGGAKIKTFTGNRLSSERTAVDFTRPGSAVSFTVDIPETGVYDLAFVTVDYSNKETGLR